MNGDLAQLSVGGIFAILVIRGVVEIIKAANARVNSNSKNTTNGMLRDLRDWHIMREDSFKQVNKIAERQLEATQDLVSTLKSRPCIIDQDRSKFGTSSSRRLSLRTIGLLRFYRVICGCLWRLRRIFCGGSPTALRV